MKKKVVWLITSCLIVATLLMVSCGPVEVEDEEVVSAPTPTIPKPVELWSADGIIKVGEYTSDVQYGDYQIFWWSDDQYAYIGLRAKTNGFVAVGIQPGSRMENADMIFGYVEAGETTIMDMFSTGDFGPHPPDTELGGTNDIIEYGGSEVDGLTTIEFKRPLSTGDKYDNPLSKGINKIIWSYGSADEIEQKHIARGYGEITL